MENNKNIAKRLTASVITIILLAIGLSVTTFALVWVTVRVENNLFSTGKIEINLNDGKPVIEEHEFLIEPGATVKKAFFIENNSTWDVYYKLYFDDVEGGLADTLEVQILDGETVLFKGSPSNLTKAKASASDDVLSLKERKELNIMFYFPENSGNSTQNNSLTFNFCAEAVQTKNNPDKLFS